MEFDATQVYEDDDFSPTQRISHTSEEEEPIQVGTLSINSNEYQIKRGTTKIGRLNSCDIVINDVTVSKIHAEIEAMRNQGSRIWICDLNSSNKTRLDDEILLPTRLYEVKDGSIIKFGRVLATYRAYRSTVIPETPAPSRQRVTGTIIPSTPDSSLNSSGDDGSVILGTQREEQNSVFRRPLVPRQSTSFGKKNISHTSFSESDDLQTATVLHASNISENQEPSNIFDMETQKLEEHETVASNSIHDIETQMFPANASIHQANTKTNKQLQSKLNVQDEVASTSATNIYDMETQQYASSINELETQKSEDNIPNVTSKKFTTDIHNAQTQNYIDDTDKDTDKNKNERKDLDQVECNINDLETQKLDNKDIAEDVSNVETQPESNGIRNTTRNICDVETQLEMDGSVNDVNDDRDYTDKDITKTTKNGTNDNEKYKDNMAEIKINYNVTHSPNSRSSSPGSLNLSSPGVDEDCLSSLQHSDHLLESSDLLEYFGEGIDKREEIRASRNTSTPKSHSKALSERDNAENVSSVSNNDEDNIFDAPTQRSIREFEEGLDEINEKDVSLIRKLSKKKRESKESIDDDPEMDTEEHSKKLTKKQRKSSEISNKSCNDSVDNRNDPATSVESEDIFDALTQQSNSPAVKDTSNSPINQLSKINETDAVVDDMAPTQIINNNENTHDQCNLTNTHKLLTDINSINSAIEDRQKKHVGRKKTEESFQTIANDSLEQKLNEMFDNVNSNDIDEPPPHISTQTLEDILESSQCDNDLSANKSTVNESSPSDNVSQTQLGKKSRAPCDQSRDPADTEANNVNKVEINSQNYFSTPTTRQKRNILKETQELVDSMQIVIPSRQDSNTSQISKVDNEKVDDNTATEFNKRKKKISNSRNKSEAMADTSNDDNVTETISKGNNERNLRRSMKRKDGTASERGKRVLRRDPGKVKIDDVEKDSVSESNVCAPCPSEDAEHSMQTSDTYESDDDILTRLPAVRISGTLSNPVSPSASSTSTVRSDRSNRGIVKGKNKEIVSSRNKSLREQAVEDSEKDESPNRIHDKPSVSLLDNNMPSFNALKTDKVTRNFMDTSEDSDSETNYKRFKQMADRMLNNEFDSLKRQSKRNVQNKKSDKKKGARSSPNLSNDLKRDTDDELKSSSQTSSRMTRHSSRQNDKSSNVSRKEACMENATYDKSKKPETRSIVPGRKRTLSTIEKDVEQTNSRKRKACQVEERPVLTRARRNTMRTTIDRQSPNIVDHFTSSRSNSPVIGNTKSFRSNKTVPETALEESKKTLNLKTDENIYSGRSYTKRKINDDQAAMCVDDVTANESSNSNKQVQAQESKTEVNLSQDKILKIVISPLKSPIINPIEDESQEVEMIMGKSPSNVQDKNSSIRETNTAKIFQRRSRLRSRKQLNADTKTDSTLTESSTSSSISDSNNTQSDDSTSTTKTRRRFTRSFVAGTQASKKKETFKRPTRVNQNSASLVFDSSTENTISECSQNSMENDTLSSSRASRSKVAGVRKTEKIEMNQSMRRMVNDSASRINTSIEIASPPSTPSTRMRRSASVLSNSTLSAARHKILFTGITEDYSKIVKTLGGIKVEDPAKCSVLVTDKVRRTYKFLCALAKGVPIVAIDWLRDSESAARFLDWEGYILKDPAAEAKFGFRLRKSLDKAKEKKLLDGYTVVLTSNVAPPPIEELKDMVTSCGGKALVRPPNKWPEKAVIISREEDLPNAKKFLMKAPKTVTIQSTEFILTGILRQETDFVKYRIT